MRSPESSFWTMIRAAIQAPSSHNTQPWYFELAPSSISLRADRTRGLPVNDPFDRELTMSCGAALCNLELAAFVEGYDSVVDVFPDSNDPDLLAVVNLAKVSSMRPLTLSDAIEQRSSTRGPLAAPHDLVDLHEVVNELEKAVKDSEAFLSFDADRFVVAGLVADGDRQQFDDPHWRRELAGWLHPRRKGDGLLVPEVVGLANKAVVSLLDLGPSTARADRSLIMEAPLLAILSTMSDGAADWLEAGRALQLMLLTATSMGLMGGFENQPCQVASLRADLRSHLPQQRFPQAIVRIGIGQVPKRRTARRPLEEVVLIGG